MAESLFGNPLIVGSDAKPFFSRSMASEELVTIGDLRHNGDWIPITRLQRDFDVGPCFLKGFVPKLWRAIPEAWFSLPDVPPPSPCFTMHTVRYSARLSGHVLAHSGRPRCPPSCRSVLGWGFAFSLVLRLEGADSCSSGFRLPLRRRFQVSSPCFTDAASSPVSSVPGSRLSFLWTPSCYD